MDVLIPTWNGMKTRYKQRARSGGTKSSQTLFLGPLVPAIKPTLQWVAVTPSKCRYSPSTTQVASADNGRIKVTTITYT